MAGLLFGILPGAVPAREAAGRLRPARRRARDRKARARRCSSCAWGMRPSACGQT